MTSSSEAVSTTDITPPLPRPEAVSKARRQGSLISLLGRFCSNSDVFCWYEIEHSNLKFEFQSIGIYSCTIPIVVSKRRLRGKYLGKHITACCFRTPFVSGVHSTPPFDRLWSSWNILKTPMAIHIVSSCCILSYTR